MHIESLETLLPMLRATVHSARDEHCEALALYRTHLEAAQRQGLGRMSAHFLADMAWCVWCGGEHAEALQIAQRAAQAIDACMHPDDRATAHQRLGQLHTAASQPSAAAPHFEAARWAWNAHRALQVQALNLLSSLPAPVRMAPARQAQARPQP